MIQTRNQVEQLTSAWLAHAFTGKLVPQKANEEPAAALPKRIRKHVRRRNE